MNAAGEAVEPSREELDAMVGRVLVEFGASWCGHCRAAQPALRTLLDARPDLVHLRIEDGPGKPLGRSFRVKLWPTLVLVDAGTELARVVRPTASADLAPIADQLG